MRIYVGGSRRFGERPADVMLLHQALTALHSPGDKVRELVQGGQGKYDPDMRRWLGADYWGSKWAWENGVVCITLKPLWNLQGRGAGIIRNDRLLKEYPPDLCLFTRGGPGTEAARATATRLGYRIEYVGDQT